MPNLAITWSVTNPAVGTISSDGVLTTGDNLGKYKGAVQASARVVVGAAPKKSVLSWLIGGQAEAQAFMTAVATVEVYLLPTGTSVTATTTGPAAASPASSGGGNNTPAPSNILLLINDGAPETDSRTVSLSLYATNASYMKISEYTDFHDATKWLSYSTAQSFRLSDGYGKKTVYAKYKNANGEESPTTSAIVNYVSKLSGTAVAAPTAANDAIKMYNYVVVNAARSGTMPSLPQIISPTPNSFVLGDQIVVTGSALPNTVVTLHIHSAGEIIVKAVTDSHGVFVYDFSQSGLAVGNHQIYASIDETQGSLVGPAVPFSVIMSTTAETSLSRSTGSNQWVALLLGGWLLLVLASLYLFRRILAGRGYGFIDALTGFEEHLADRTWWSGLPRRFAAWCAGLPARLKALIQKVLHRNR